MKIPKVVIACRAYRFIMTAVTIVVINWLIPLNESDLAIANMYDNMDDVIFFSLNNSGYPEKEFRKLSDKIREYHTFYDNSCKVDGVVFKALICDEYLAGKLNLSLNKGKGISDSSDIILSKTAGEKYNVGDLITIEYPDENMIPQRIEKRVCGILKTDIFPRNGGGGEMEIAVSNMSESLYDSRNDLNGFGFISRDPVFRNQRERDITGRYFIEYSGDAALVLQDLSGIGIGISGKEAIEKSHDKFRNTSAGYKQLILILIMQTVLVIVGTNFIDFYTRRKENSVWLLCGISTRQIIGSEMLKLAVSGAVITVISLLVSNLMISTFQGMTVTFSGFWVGIAVFIFFVGVSYFILKAFIREKNLSEEFRGE